MPEVPRLCFWALQASFSNGSDRLGAAHLGLQWNRRFPGGRAVNWGGYGADGQVLAGSLSPLASTSDDPNTRDFHWEPGRPYRLRIEQAEPGWWRGMVVSEGQAVEVRRLPGGGDRLVSLVVWSEIFSRCDDPPVEVTWSSPWIDPIPPGAPNAPLTYRVTYQPVDRGGCSNTDIVAEQGRVRQVTNRRRRIIEGSRIPVG